ncbi:4Fe-4S binding protein [Aquimixticola soesokkakensis]|uniref:4Fe-4S binding protein n=1 Tax=Aquimixticola soesokkakensis TaxID=1519096 RepID=UPI0035217EAB
MALERAQIAAHIDPPMQLGDPLGDDGVYALLNSGGTQVGYVFETAPRAPLPGFSGQPINMLVTLDTEGRFLDVELLHHNEPIFVSGLGEAPFRAFLEQYRGHSIAQSLVVGTPYGAGGTGSDLTYLDGVTKATASVRIAHESILAAALGVAREKMQGIATRPPLRPDPDVTASLTWPDLVETGIARHLVVRNGEVANAFAGTLWADDDPDGAAAPDAPFIDLWLIDIGPPAIARAVLDADGFAELQRFLQTAPESEPLLLIETARHGLVSQDFIRNTAPDRLSAEQDGLPLALRDADLSFGFSDSVPEALKDGIAMILRTDRRLGFDPTRDWTLQVQALRSHGMFQPETGSRHFPLTYAAPPQFYRSSETAPRRPVWQQALIQRKTDLFVLIPFLALVLVVNGPALRPSASRRWFTPLRLAILATTIGFVGWWGQGQLSIVTVMAVLRAALGAGSLSVLLYDPFSLAIWGVTLIGFVLWGRGLFCGWLCPFGAMQEFTAHLGRRLRLPQLEPSALWDHRLKRGKYLALAAVLGVTVLAPAQSENIAEIEPFKTAVTTYFIRDWVYVAYAVFWLTLSMVTFKGFCRYVCPLGAVMAIAGRLRLRNWIARRIECGSPCQLCRVKCRYGAIEKSGAIDYTECFSCMDCVGIFDDPHRCVPQILATKRSTP